MLLERLRFPTGTGTCSNKRPFHMTCYRLNQQYLKITKDHLKNQHLEYIYLVQNDKHFVEK